MSHQRLDDGFSTTITFSLNGAIKFFEKTVTPPGMDAGGEVDTSTMRNLKYRTRNPKKLITVSPGAGTVAWDPQAYNDVIAMLGVNQQITFTLPDGSSVEIWGWLDKFVPGEHVEGTQPTATINIEPSNQDNSKVEQAPVVVLA